MSMAFIDSEGGGGTRSGVSSRYLTNVRYEGAGANRVRFDIYSDGTEEGPFEDPVADGTDGGAGGGGNDGAGGGNDGAGGGNDGAGGGNKTNPRFYGTNPELLQTLNDYFASLGGADDARAANLRTYARDAIQGFISGRFSFEDVFGSLRDLSGKITSALGTTPPPDAAAIAASQRQENAFTLVTAFLQRAGLQGLDAQIRALLAQGIEDSDAILFRLRDTEQFRTRFKANAARAAKGLPELDPATYIGLEQQYRSVLVANRLPTEFYDSPDDFARLIEGDVSPSEFQARINEGYAKVRDADPQVLNTLRQFYPEVGNDENALAAYFIDPARALTSLQRQVEAARIGARGREQAGFQFGAGTAEELVRRGYTAEGTQAAFQRAGQLAGLYQEMGGEEALTTEQKVGAALGFDVQAQQTLEQRQRQRLAQFQGGGGFARTSGATSGTVETGVGTAQ